MKKIFVSNCLKLIKRYNPDYSITKITEIKYGLDSLYILITKTFFVFFLATIFNLVIETLIFIFLYNFIRMPSFGLHTNKSWICYISSAIIFIITPLICNLIKISLFIKLIIGVLIIALIFKNAPADTQKRPIIDKKRRYIYKFISTFVATTFIITSLIINNNFISNSLIMVLIVQNIMISPLTYKVLNLPYNNYLTYVNKSPI